MPGPARIASLLAACGLPALASDLQLATATNADPDQIRIMGHVYVNASTGDRIITRYGQPLRLEDAGQSTQHGQAGQRGSDLNPLWLAQGANPCPPLGVTRQIYRADDPGRDPSDPAFNRATRALYLDWGDLPANTLVQAFGTTYFAQHADPDSNGVPGLGATFIYRDGEDGSNDCCSSQGVLSVTVRDLPGNSGQFAFEAWEITIDLVADPSNPLSFELGDTDGDGQGAALFNPFGYEDVDGDSLHDFAHGITFHQPGTFDFDGDGVLDGDPAAAAATYLLLVAPEGTVTQDPDDPSDDLFTDIAPLPSAQGLEDGFDLYINVTPDNFTCPSNYLGRFWFGGFNCPDAIDPDPRPFASFAHRLYNFSTTTNPCPADITGDGTLNFNDTIAFLGLFNTQDPGADLTGDGLINFNDFLAFLNAFNAGCP